MKKMRVFVGFFLVMIVLILGIGGYKYGPLFNFYIIPPSPQKFASIAVNEMDQKGLFARGDYWEKVKQETLNRVKGAKSYAETLPALSKAVEVAGGKHSTIYQENQVDKTDVVMPTAKVNQGILTIEIPEFVGNEAQAKTYAKKISNALLNTSYKDLIIDLSKNRGGDMGPMISGLAPILPDGILVFAIDKNHSEREITLSNNQLSGGGTPVDIGSAKKIKDLRVALLLGRETGSSGEITAMSFLGLKNVKTFGTPTAGYTTVNWQFNMYNGYTMQVTTEMLKDRMGKVYKNSPIEPDVQTNQAYEKATEWFKSEKK